MGSLMKLTAMLLYWFFGILFILGQVEGAENPKPKVQISSRFFDGDNLLSAPRLLATVGQEAVIKVTQEDGEHLDGIMLSVTPEVVDGKVFLEGFAFAGKGKLGGDDGINSRAKKALESLKEKGGGIDKIEMRGLFSIGGQPRIALSVDGGSAFWLQPGQTHRGMKLLRVEGDKDPYAVLEAKGRQIRLFLKATRRSELVPLFSMKGGGGVFLREMVPGKKWVFPIFRQDGTSCKVEMSAQVVTP
jgi:hypothetical protein